MTPNDLTPWLDDAERFALEAGRLLMEGWRGAPDVQQKGRIDLVTEYDLKSEALLRERMRDAFPEHGWVGEETDAVHRDRELVWFVDPIDGTTNFAHGHFYFGVSIGLAQRSERGLEPLLGVVHAPALGVTWKGIVGAGAWRNEETIQVSQVDRLEAALVATGFPYDRGTSEDNNLAEANALIPRVQGIRRCGAAALDVCLVADSTYDAYWEQKVSPWDICAGLAIAAAAGATLTDYEGKPATADSRRLVVANPGLHATLLRGVQEARRRATHS
ncbi:MAG: inositol monophosphatase [Sandaracinaceae bacterium]